MRLFLVGEDAAHRPDVRASVAEALGDGAIEICGEGDPREACARVGRSNDDAIVVDAIVVDATWIEEPLDRVLRFLRTELPQLPLLLFVASGTDVADDVLDVVDGLIDPASPARTSVRRVRGDIARHRDATSTSRLVHGAPLPAFVVDGEGCIVEANAAAEELFGRPRERLCGEAFALPLAGVPEEIDILRPDGRLRIATARVDPIRWEGAEANLVWALDVTDQHQARGLRSRLARLDHAASVGRLCRGIAHEINNPATLLAANLEISRLKLAALVGVARDDEAKILGELEDLVRDGSLALEQVTQAVRKLEILSVPAGLANEAADIGEIAEEACRLMAHDIRHRARLECTRSPCPPIPCDRAALRQVIVNLLVGASHGLPTGSAELHEIHVEAWAKDGSVHLAITDDTDTEAGRAGEVSHLLDLETLGALPFKIRSDLLLCEEVIREHGGHIRLRPPETGGTRIEIEIPERTESVPSNDARSPKASPARGAMRNGRVLLIDDDSLAARGLARLLNWLGHDVVASDDGNEALGILEEDRAFDAILCDLMMPNVNGRQFLAKLSERHPELRDRVVFLTGGFLSEPTEASDAALERPTLTKPVSSADLEAALAAAGHSGEKG